MTDIVLATLNARYAHASLGLRCLLANLRPSLQSRAALCEFTVKESPEAICARLLRDEPRIVGLGVYIWNVTATLEVVKRLRALRPEVRVVLGGPEVSHETHGQPIVEAADFVICGEGEVSFDVLCAALLLEEGPLPAHKVISSSLPDIQTLALPYRQYTQEDVQNRVMYVEASRGCPYTCEFCLSSLDARVRDFPLEPFLAEMETLLRRGVRQFKFIDRTFNLKLQTSTAILQFFLERYTPGLFLHFEMVPDRLPEALRSLVAQFPPGALQFEVGVQTLNDDVARRIRRRQDLSRTEDNFRFLTTHTGVHLHADLLVGLPGEDLASFGRGFDRLLSWKPQEIQVGMLKRLRGTPIVRHDGEWDMVYDDAPPYEVQSTRVMDAATVARMRRFSQYWNRIANSGNFRDSVRAVLAQGDSPFAAFLRLSDSFHAQLGRAPALSLEQLAEAMVDFLQAELGCTREDAGHRVLEDYLRPVSRRIPTELKAFAGSVTRPRGHVASNLPKRQARHLA